LLVDRFSRLTVVVSVAPLGFAVAVRTYAPGDRDPFVDVVDTDVTVVEGDTERSSPARGGSPSA
jgi:hypothetical protein